MGSSASAAADAVDELDWAMKHLNLTNEHVKRVDIFSTDATVLVMAARDGKSGAEALELLAASRLNQIEMGRAHREAKERAQLKELIEKYGVPVTGDDQPPE